MSLMQQVPSALTLAPLSHAGPAMRWRTEGMRSHTTARLILITKGQGRVTVAGLTNGYGANNLIYLPPQTMYGIEVGPSVHGHILTLPDASDWPSLPVHLRLMDVWLQKEAAQYFDQIERELQPAGNSKAAVLWLGLLAICVERQARTQVATPNAVASRSRNARRWHCCMIVSITRLACCCATPEPRSTGSQTCSAFTLQPISPAAFRTNPARRRQSSGAPAVAASHGNGLILLGQTRHMSFLLPTNVVFGQLTCNAPVDARGEMRRYGVNPTIGVTHNWHRTCQCQ